MNVEKGTFLTSSHYQILVFLAFQVPACYQICHIGNSNVKNSILLRRRITQMSYKNKVVI